MQTGAERLEIDQLQELSSFGARGGRATTYARHP